MNYRLVARDLGIVSQLAGVAMLFSLPWAFPYLGGGEQTEGRAIAALLGTSTIAVILGVTLFLFGRQTSAHMYRKESMAIVGLSWIVMSMLGAIPFLLSGTQSAEGKPMTVADALFESASGFTGTGATVLTNVEDPRLVPRSILFWRSETHFLGGLGIMVLFVALLGQGSAGKALKIIWLELEHAYRPTVVRPLRLGGQMVEEREIRKNVLVYFGLTVLIIVASWMLLDVLEPDEHWSQLGHQRHEKLIDCASGVAATLNGVGPGLGVIGAVENYSHFQPASKLLFVLLMLLGRLELFVILVLFLPQFWRNR